MVNAVAAPDIRAADDPAALRAAWPVVAQLRPHLDEAAFLAQALRQQAEGWRATVLLEGETGTGKEAAAESIHRESHRADGPFVVVDCGSIPPELMEAELFGHARGAFTGADRDRLGAFEEANGGTLFLDEIGELRADLQPKLLRALDRREVKRVGSQKTVPLDFRVIAATNRDLRAEVNLKTAKGLLEARAGFLDQAARGEAACDVGPERVSPRAPRREVRQTLDQG